MRHANFLIKPASSACNLRCRYCFYEDESENRTLKNMGLMSRETAELLLKRAYAEIEPGGSLSFAFQGGEPTVAGLDFFRFFTAKARELRPERVQIAFSIQTNGTLLNEDWAEFFYQEDFLVGLPLAADLQRRLQKRLGQGRTGAGAQLLLRRLPRAARLCGAALSEYRPRRAQRPAGNAIRIMREGEGL